MNNNNHSPSYLNALEIPAMLEKAVRLHQTGSIESAVEIYEKIIQADPENPDALHLLGYATHQLGKNTKAENLIRQAINQSSKNISFYNSLGLVLKAQGKLDQAISSYQSALVLDPESIESYNNLGLVFQDQGKFEDAVACFQKALTIHPEIPVLNNNMGNLYQTFKRSDEAIPYYKKALALDPGYAEAHCNLGSAFQSKNLLIEAENSYQNALDIDPLYFDACFNMGTICHKLGKPKAAIAFYEKALEIQPDSFDTLINLGILLKQQEMVQESVSCLKKAIKIKPCSPDAWYYLGTTLQKQGQGDEAMACFHKALEIDPSHLETAHIMAILLQEYGNPHEALQYYGKVLALNPEYAEAHHNMGSTYQTMGNPDEAINCFKKALALNPRLAQTHVAMGIAFTEKKQIKDAYQCYKKALEIDPDNALANAQLLYHALNTCSWREFLIYSQKLVDLTTNALKNHEKPAEMPFLSLMREAHPSRYRAIASSWSLDISRTVRSIQPAFPFDSNRLSKKKITVGYVSSNFRNHPNAHLILGLFGLHNRADFEVFCYSYGPDDGSYYRKRIARDCDKFIDIQHMGDLDAAKQIYQDKVDILVDLIGHTKGNRMSIFACRPALIQVRYLGFPGTTGADFFDYFITDTIATPREHAPYYSECFAYLPNCYQINDNTQPISNKIWNKSDFGLPEKSFVFCSFNQPYKIDPSIFEIWMKILQKVPQAVLWLLKGNDPAEKHLKQEASVRGIDPGRLIFSEPLPKAEHLARLRLADLALDTITVNGHITTSDALWAGVPVIVQTGRHFISRVSTSILTAINLPELITNNLEEYETLAIKLSQNPEELDLIRQKVANNQSTQPLFDTPRFTRNLEKAYKEMMKLKISGSPPRQITVLEN